MKEPQSNRLRKWSRAQYALKDYFDFYLEEGKAFHHQKALYEDYGHQLIMRIVKAYLTFPVKKARCLDLGCAEGYYTSWLAKKSKFSVGIDISPPKLERAIKESKDPRNSFLLADWDYLPFRNSAFNIVLFIEGPEHCLDADKTIKEIARVLVRGGFLLLSAPISDKDTFHQDALKFDGHFRNFTPNSLSNLLNKNFEVIKAHFSTSSGFVRKIIDFIVETRLSRLIFEPIRKKFSPLMYKRMKPKVGIILARKRKLSFSIKIA